MNPDIFPPLGCNQISKPVMCQFMDHSVDHPESFLMRNERGIMEIGVSEDGAGSILHCYFFVLAWKQLIILFEGVFKPKVFIKEVHTLDCYFLQKIFHLLQDFVIGFRAKKSHGNILIYLIFTNSASLSSIIL